MNMKLIFQLCQFNQLCPLALLLNIQKKEGDAFRQRTEKRVENLSQKKKNIKKKNQDPKKIQSESQIKIERKYEEMENDDGGANNENEQDHLYLGDMNDRYNLDGTLLNQLDLQNQDQENNHQINMNHNDFNNFNNTDDNRKANKRVINVNNQKNNVQPFENQNIRNGLQNVMNNDNQYNQNNLNNQFYNSDTNRNISSKINDQNKLHNINDSQNNMIIKNTSNDINLNTSQKNNKQAKVREKQNMNSIEQIDGNNQNQFQQVSTSPKHWDQNNQQMTNQTCEISLHDQQQFSDIWSKIQFDKPIQPYIDLISCIKDIYKRQDIKDPIEFFEKLNKAQENENNDGQYQNISHKNLIKEGFMSFYELIEPIINISLQNTVTKKKQAKPRQSKKEKNSMLNNIESINDNNNQQLNTQDQNNFINKLNQPKETKPRKKQKLNQS